MNRFFILVLLIITITFSCKKKSETSPSPNVWTKVSGLSLNLPLLYSANNELYILNAYTSIPYGVGPFYKINSSGNLAYTSASTSDSFTTNYIPSAGFTPNFLVQSGYRYVGNVWTTNKYMNFYSLTANQNYPYNFPTDSFAYHALNIIFPDYSYTAPVSSPYVALAGDSSGYSLINYTVSYNSSDSVNGVSVLSRMRLSGSPALPNIQNLAQISTLVPTAYLIPYKGSYILKFTGFGDTTTMYSITANGSYRQCFMTKITNNYTQLFVKNDTLFAVTPQYAIAGLPTSATIQYTLDGYYWNFLSEFYSTTPVYTNPISLIADNFCYWDSSGIKSFSFSIDYYDSYLNMQGIDSSLTTGVLYSTTDKVYALGFSSSNDIVGTLYYKSLSDFK